MIHKKATRILATISGAAILAGFNLQKNSLIVKNQQAMKPVYELAINQSNKGQHQHFLTTREAFVEVLGKENASLNEGKWKPIFAVDPDLNLEAILIGMTHWSSMEGFGEAASRLMPQKVSVDYFSSFTPLAYALLEPVDGQPFDMESIKKAGNVVEFAIRKGKNPEAFGKERDTFFKSLEAYDGYKFAREFKVYKLNEQGMPNLAENTQAVIIVWESGETFQAAAPQIFPSEPYRNFAALLEVEAYFASLPAN
ncbi:hypothetical protein SAMN05192553_107104 [Cyclobacterium xiamenense]|uniref:Uncharacterized protein n=1 Tax=Cyclobacterium xiamenense TaxID=1297121 RepID=A0A1H7AKY5_9BACT|nr:hypothetical protein [Cyclobacterium xiamenense]SEJ65586.1 hypothetical protein SAMN05192553_107104 [Cyclobacterium xiamenense]